MLGRLRSPDSLALSRLALPPLVLLHVQSREGELRLLSTFTTFGMPLDITVASLRIDHLIPADTRTW